MIFLAPLRLSKVAALTRVAGGFGQVVHQQNIAAADFADDGHGLGFGGVFAAFGDDGQAGFQHLGIGVGHFQSADIRADHHQIGDVHRLEIFIHDRRGIKMIHRDVEKALNLLGVEVHGQGCGWPRRRPGGWRPAWR